MILTVETKSRPACILGLSVVLNLAGREVRVDAVLLACQKSHAALRK